MKKNSVSVFLPVLLSITFMLHWIPTDAQQNNPVKNPDSWTILETYEIPGKASGLAWDGNYIYYGIYGSNGDLVYSFDPASGQYNTLFSNPSINDSYGMTFDGTDLWITDHGLSSSVPAYALQLDLAGNSLSEFDLPDHYMSGIAYDNGDFWVCTYYPNPGTIYRLDNSGAVLSQFPAPDEQPWDICTEGDYLWIADYDANMLYKTDSIGTIIESHESENIKPAGIVFDGQYLWYVDGQTSSPSTLYKVDLSGAGTPAIDIPVTSYNFGIVTIEDSASWYCSISNNGTANLEITNLIIQNAVPIFTNGAFPLLITPGNTIEYEFRYMPTEPGTLNTIVVVECNDPVVPEVELSLFGDAVFDGPHIQVSTSQHNYGSVRQNATSRWFLEVSNNGNEQLEITDIAFDGEHFYLEPNLSLPLAIDVLEVSQVGIWFHPDGVGTFEGTATLAHNDASQENIEINLSGLGSDASYPIGEEFWSFFINASYDNSIKAIVAIQDISNDGVDDLIACSEDNFVRCFNGNSSGSGDLLWENEVGSVYGQNGLTTIEDIDGDGKQDVIVGLAWGERSIKALSGTTGNQVWIYDTHQYGDGGWVYQVWTGFDFNGDDLNDVLAATGNDGNNTGPKRIFCLDGSDGSVIWDTFTDGANFACMGVMDFTGDDQPDVIGGSSNNSETEGKVYGIDGSNGSISWTYTASGTSVWALEQLDDITGDGIMDVIAGDFGGNYYLLDAVNGNMEYSGSAGNTIFLRFERLDDVNGNGYSDIAFAYSGTNAIVVDGFDGSNIWLTPLADKCWSIDRIEDITGDGISDLIAGTLFSNNYCYFLDGVTGEDIHSLNFGEAIDAIGAIPDINNDGSWEMVAGGRNGKLVCFSSGAVENILMADFVADNTNGPVPLNVQFTDISIGNITSWEWDFDNDGTIDATIQNPQYTYLSAATYSVALTVSNGSTSHTTLKENYIIADTMVLTKEIYQKSEFYAAPNPFQNGTNIIVNSNTKTSLKLDISNFHGQRVRTLAPSSKTTDIQIFRWDGRDANGDILPPGIYIATTINNGHLMTLKLLLCE